MNDRNLVGPTLRRLIRGSRPEPETVGAGPVQRARRAPGSADAVLRQAAGWLLPGAPPIDELADGAAAAMLVEQATATRLLGPLLLAVDHGALALPEEQLELAAVSHEASMRWCLQLETRLLEVAAWFDAAGGIEMRVVKGPAVAHLDEPDPSLRSFADLDLLIASDDMDRAISALEAGGAVRRIPERRPGFDRRFAKGVGMTCGDQVEIDVHRTLCAGALGHRIPLDRLFAQPARFTIGGTSVLAPRLEHRALHAAYHAVVGGGPPPLRTLRDLAGYLTNPALTPDGLSAEARRWGGQAVLAEAVRATVGELAFDAPAWVTWLQEVRLAPSELALVEERRRPGIWPAEFSMVAELPWKDKGSFLWAVAVPSAEVLADREQSHWSRLVEGAARVRRRLPPRRSPS